MNNIDPNKQTDGLNSGSKKLQEIIKQLFSKQREELIKMLNETQKTILLENLKKTDITVEEDVEVLGFKGRKVHVSLPAVGDFKGLKFDYFVGDEKDDISYRHNCTEYAFEISPELKEKSYSYEEINNLYKTIREYFGEFGIKMNDYDLAKLLSLEGTYFLRDKYPKLDRCCGYNFLTLDHGTVSDYMPDYCRYSGEKGANLLLKISE